jgi:hypothetical protein
VNHVLDIVQIYAKDQGWSKKEDCPFYNEGCNAKCPPEFLEEDCRHKLISDEDFK